jgi:hypothetical protein
MEKYMNTQREAGKTNVTRKFADACVDRCQRLIAHIAKVKANLVTEFSEKFAVQDQQLRLAVNEAEALAWETDYPHLVFPTLALEKVKVAAAWNERQGAIREGSSLVFSA